MSEIKIMHAIQLAMSRIGTRVFRNNSGRAKDVRSGNWIQYGVASPGGSDLIGWTPIEVTEQMVGKTVALFTAVEVKTLKGKTTEQQENFISQVNNSGGIGFVSVSEADATAKINGHKNRLQKFK